MNDKDIRKCIAAMERLVPGMSLKTTRELLYKCCGSELVSDRKTRRYLDKMAKYIVQAYKTGRKDGKEARPQQSFPTGTSGIAGSVVEMAAAAYNAGYCIGKEYRRMNGGENK